MRKEILVAIIVGILLGVGVAFGIWRANSAFNNNAQETSEIADSEQEESSGNDAETTNGLTLVKPENLDVSTTESITLSGLTKPKSVIFISSEEVDYTTTSNQEGEFSQEIELIGGINQIIIKAYDASSNSNSEIVNLIYSSQLEEANQEEGESIEEKVQDKIQRASNKLKAYIGTLTDITDSTLQIEDYQDEIQLVSTDDDETEYADITDTPEEVDLNDLAIGDYLIAMGYVDENSVLNSLRILVTLPPDEITRKVIKGKVEEVNRSSFTLTVDGDSIEIITSRFTDVFLIDDGNLVESSTTDLEENQMVYVSTNTSDDEQNARNIVIYELPSPEEQNN